LEKTLAETKDMLKEPKSGQFEEQKRQIKALENRLDQANDQKTTAISKLVHFSFML